jgi:hypothetical protein
VRQVRGLWLGIVHAARQFLLAADDQHQKGFQPGGSAPEKEKLRRS